MKYRKNSRVYQIDNRKMMIIILLILCLLMTVSLAGCNAPVSQQEEKQHTEPQTMHKYSFSAKRKVIIDTDTGGDDASALILAAKSGNLDIIGVTTLVGNVGLDQAAKNALAALEIAGSDAPVYKGSSDNISGEKINAFSVYGTDGMGDMDLIHPKGKAQDKDAIDFMLETVAQYPDEIEIISIGPATNIAKAIERDPDTMKKVKMIWSMGTAGIGTGNASPVAEFNVYHDPHAYKIMLDFGIPITIIGLDMCDGDAMWTDAQFDKLRETNHIGEFVTSSFTKLREFFNKNHSGGRVNNCDATAMMCAVYDGFITDTIRCHGSCITEKGETYGQVIFYQQGFTYDVVDNDFDYNVTLVSGVRKMDYFDLYRQTIMS